MSTDQDNRASVTVVSGPQPPVDPAFLAALDSSRKTERETAASARDVPAVPPANPSDWFLGALVHATNAAGVVSPLGVVLSVRGALISGTLASGRAYFNGIADEIDAQSDGDMKPAAGAIREIADDYPAPVDRATPEDEGNRNAVRKGHTLPTFIHLKDARFFSAGQPPIPGNRGVWWRGRLSAVDGFTLGSLEVQP